MKTANLMPVFLTVLFLSACGSSATPISTQAPVDINALQTAAVQTVMANITETALAQPSEVATEALVPTDAGPTETLAPVVTATPKLQLCDDLAFVSDTSVTDGTPMTAGQAFVKSWMVKNTGSCTWKTSYQLIFGYGEKMGGLPTALPSEVPPGSQFEISINLKAPVKTGNYSGYWRLANNNGVPFGQFFSVIISVP